MKLNTIKIKNFRCFESTEISFGSKATVFIGKNGTGKSSIISALKRGLSFLFAKNNNFANNLCNSNNAKIRGFEFWDANFDEIKRIFNYYVSIDLNGTFENKPIEWALFKKDAKSKRLYSTLYENAQNTVLEHYNNGVENAKLPILAFYSDSYPHVLSNVGSVAKKIVTKDIIPRDFGYYGWDEITNCMELWLIRYKKVSKFIRDYQIDLERIENQIKDFTEKNNVNGTANILTLNQRLEAIKNDKRITSFKKELDFIDSKIIKLTEPLRSDLDFINDEFQIVRLLSNSPTEDVKDDSLEFIFANGSSIFFEMLPQGYKRIFSIAIDLAYRNYILNETNDSEGIVFIDEIELHLHPTLQQEILQRLVKAFPNVQFITTTHSISVVSNLKTDREENKIIKLEKEGLIYSNTPINDIFGIDYSTGLMDIMGATYRSTHIDNLIDSYVILKIRNRHNDAQKIWDEIFAIVGINNEIIKKEISEKVEANR